MLRVIKSSAATRAASSVVKTPRSLNAKIVNNINSSFRRLAFVGYSSTTRYSSNDSGSSKVETREFQAETRKLLDIVTNSIYTDKEVFIRELISNASDALEKFRFKQVLGSAVAEGENGTQPLEINIITDYENNCLILSDNGIGMTREELISNLGTIARSGSKQFVENLKSTSSEAGSAVGPGSNGDGIIGQFGVGFYSSFMVSESVTVESMPAALLDSDGNILTAIPNKWSSDGSGMFTIEEFPESELKDTGRGSRIVMKLKDSCKEYSKEDKIKRYVCSG